MEKIKTKRTNFGWGKAVAMCKTTPTPHMSKSMANRYHTQPTQHAFGQNLDRVIVLAVCIVLADSNTH
jgi:hypothetical protein